MTSSTISHHFKLNPGNHDIPELMQPDLADSEDSGRSDTEVFELPITEDLDYQESTNNRISRFLYYLDH